MKHNGVTILELSSGKDIFRLAVMFVDVVRGDMCKHNTKLLEQCSRRCENNEQAWMCHSGSPCNTGSPRNIDRTMLRKSDSEDPFSSNRTIVTTAKSCRRTLWRRGETGFLAIIIFLLGKII